MAALVSQDLTVKTPGQRVVCVPVGEDIVLGTVNFMVMQVNCSVGISAPLITIAAIINNFNQEVLMSSEESVLFTIFGGDQA